MDTTSKEESEPMEPEIQALQDEASGSIDVDDEDEMEELHNSLKEVVKDPSVKPKLQCLMVDPSFSMVTVQSEDSGIVWETASSRCSTPWASEGSSPSESYGLESSAAQGKITVIMDDNKIVRKRKKSGRSKLGDRIKRPSSRMAAYGTERPAMTEVSVPNVKPENDEPAELKVDKDQELFSLISEGYEILNIVVPSKLPTVDEEEAGDLVDNLSYLQDTPKIKSKSKLAPVPAGDDYQGIIVQEIINGEKEEADKITETGMKDAKKEGPDEDYLDKFKLVDSHALSEQSSSSGVPNEENIMQEPEQVKPQGELKSSPSNIEDSFVIITDNEIASEHMDEVFYANTGTMADEKNKGHDSDRKVKDEPRSLKESGSALFGSQETILIPVYLPEGPPKIIDQVLLEEPRAMSFLYTDLYDEAMGSRRRDDDHSDVESTVSEKSYKKRFSDDDEEDEGYLEKFILKDETPVVQEPLEVADDVREGGRIIWPQNKFELTGCLKRVKEEDDSGGEKTEIAATEQMEDSEKAQPVDTGKPEEISQGPITKAADGSKIEQEKEDDTEVCVGNHCEPCVAGKMIPESPESVIQNDASNLLLEERAETVEEIGKHDGEIAATEQMEDSEKAQPVDTGKPEEISQGPITKAADESKIEQEKEDDTEVCVGNHCEPCDAGKMIPESPESVIQNDISNLLLEERAETVEEIRKHDAISEKAKDSKETESEMMGISGTVSKKSPDLLNEGEQTASEKAINTIQEPETSLDMKTSSPEEVSEKLTETTTIVEEPSCKKLEGVAEIQSDVKISTEPINEAIEVKKSDEIEADQATPDTTSQVKVEETITKEKPAAPLVESDVIATAPEAMKDSKVSVVSEEQLTDSVSEIPDEVAGGSKEPNTDTIPEGKTENATVPADVIHLEDVSKSLPEVETEVLKQDSTEQEGATDTLLDEKSVAITETEMASIESPGVEVLTVEDTAARTPSPSAAPAPIEVQEVTTEDRKEGEPVEEQAEEPEDEKSVAIEKTVKDDLVISGVKDIIDTTEQLSVECPHSKVQEQKSAIQEQAVDSASQGELKVSEDVVEPDRTVEKSEATEVHQEMSPALQANVDVKNTGPEPEKVEESQQSTETPVEKVQDLTEELVNTDIICDVYEPKKVENKKFMIEFSIANREKLAGAPVEKNKHTVEQTQKKTTRRKANVPIIEVVLSKVPYTHEEKTEKQLSTSKPETPPVASESKDSEEPVTKTAEGVTSVKQDASLDSVLPQTEVKSNKQAVQLPVEAAEATRAAELDSLEPEVRETQALDEPKVKVDLIPETVNEESKVQTEVDSDGQIAVTEDYTQVTGSVYEPDTIKPDVLVSDKIVNVPVAELPSDETRGPEAVIVEKKVLDETVNDLVEEIPVAETQGPEVFSLEEISVKIAEDVVAEIPPVETSGEVLIVESKVSDETVTSVVAEIPSVETLGPEVMSAETKVSGETRGDVVAEITSVEPPGPEAITVENKAPNQPVNDVVAEIPSVETPDENLTTENKVSDQLIASVAKIPSVETLGPEVVSAETKVSDETVSVVAAEIPSVERPGADVVTVVVGKTLNDVVAEIHLVETPKEVLIAESKVLDQIDVVADIPLVEPISPKVVTEEAKVSDKTVNDIATEIPSVETPDEALIAESKVLDQIDVVADIPLVETRSPEVVTEEAEVSDKTVNDIATEIPSVETPDEVLIAESKVSDKTDVVAVQQPSPSAAPAPIEVQEVTTEDRKEGEPVEEQAEEPEGLLFSTLRSFSPKEDLSVLPEPEALKEYRDEMAEELDYEMITQQEAREYPGVEAEVIPEREEEECFTEVDTSKALEEEAAEDVLEADYEFIEESESVELSEEDQAKMQALDAFCLVCQCPVLMMEEHQNHEVCSLDRAYELLKDRLSNWISTLQERSENIEDMVSEIELVYNSVEEQCKMNEEAMDDQNEEMLRLVMDQYNEMSHTMEEEKKAKLEKLYDQIVSFQESIDIAKETLEKNSKEEEEEEEDSFTFVSSSKDINMSLTKALESTMSLELGPRGLSVFDDYAKGSGNGQKHRKGIPVPQKPHLQPQEANSATSTSVTVYWKVNEGDIIDCFQVYCMEDPQGAISEEYRVTVKESYCTLEELDPDKCYKVWVMAVNYTGCSLPSERLSFKTAPSVPVIQPERCTVLWDSATLRWASEQPSAAESYTLEYCRQYACEGEGLRSFSGIQGCEQRVLLQPNENYLLYIKAVNSAGASEQSEAALISTRGTRFQLMKETAGPALRLLEDKTTVLYSQDSFSEMASINECPAILGELLPLKGYYYWETVVSGCPSYRLGVAYSSNPSDSLLGENSTSWCLHCVPTSSSSRFELLHNSVETDIFVVDVPTRVGTLLDFAQGRLVFINAQNGHLLGSTQHRFTEPCHAAFGLESPGCLTVHMLPEVPESARHC
ncbi:cardiomyopathy-associated protein 5 isoform X2 [Alosa sapidissima]|uniref:cardiomyopathy-associated protein 5 isoform X2 n=1 Tax=Alosa sapidissima TaxID=34773 RepID=UPI001C09D0C8|nr:cardiomyopathy-associated protein 5 isoform X2 [Alosa sapidissima]